MRFEDAMVVCEDTNGKEYVIQKKKIPEEATEGNVIKKGITGKYSMDTDEEFLRKHRMEKMKKLLLNRRYTVDNKNRHCK